MQPARTRWQWSLVALLVVTLAMGCSPDGDDTPADSGLLPMTIVEWLLAPSQEPIDADPVGLAQITYTPMAPGTNSIDITLTDLRGAALSLLTETSEVSLEVRHLAPDEAFQPIALVRDQATWHVTGLELANTGWYALQIRLRDSGRTIAEARTVALLPDPSVYGTGAIDLPASQLDAAALYDRALQTYASWEAARWRESVSSGAGAVAVSAFAVTDRADEPTAMLVENRYVGAFRPRADGSAPPPPRLDFGARMIVGDHAWARESNGAWIVSPARPAATFAERAAIYAGATNIVAGGSDTLNGVETQIITFYLPSKGGQSEAWFAWWIDPATGNLVRAAMVARMHFMIWDITDINGTFAIEPPAVASGATPVPLSP
jgi:hypothetical protein